MIDTAGRRMGLRRAAGERGATLYEALPWMMVRVPLLPVEEYLRLGTEPRTVASNRLAGTPRAAAALAVGGGNILAAAERANDKDRSDRRLDGKLLRYWIRMSTRPTPLGLFAGVSLGKWGPVTNLRLSDRPPRTRTRPDMGWLLNLVFEVESRPEVRRHLNYRANTLASFRSGRIFLPEAAPTSANAPGPAPTVSVRATGAVHRALALARAPIAHDQLIAELTESTGAPPEKVEALVEDLWRHTLLLTDLRPPVTAPDPACYVAERLRAIPAAHDTSRRLEEALAALGAFDRDPFQGGAGAYRRMLADASLAGPTAAGESHPSLDAPVQVDMAVNLEGTALQCAVAHEAARAAELLLRLTPFPAGTPHLEAYKRAFEVRYGHDRQVPLLELLDPAVGLGPPARHGPSPPAGDAQRAALRRQTLQDLAISAIRERRLVVELDDETISKLETWPPTEEHSPLSIDLSLFVIAASERDIDAGSFQLVIGPNLGATAAGRNLGRFADMLGTSAMSALGTIADAEAALGPPVVRAEVAYLPRHSRSANVCIRPHRREREIAVGTTPGVPAERTVPLDELSVGIRGGRFFVAWPAAGTDILASAGHMLNNLAAPEVCRFLDDVSRDGQPQLSSWDWGPVADFPFLPRVQSGRVVLSGAQWLLDPRSCPGVKDSVGFATALSSWRIRWQVPRYVYLAFGDNRLLLDLDDDRQGAELAAEIGRAGAGALTVQEALPSPGDAWLPGPGGHYMAEFVVPMVRCPPSRPTAAPAEVANLQGAHTARHHAPAGEDRLRPPGSDWLFAKLYCPLVYQDDVLLDVVAPLCCNALASGSATDWFFVRYADPEPHLRLRLAGAPGTLTAEVLPEVCSMGAQLIREGRCQRLCFDTYDRELERYGGAVGMAAAERVFGADSRAVADILAVCRQGLTTLDLTTIALVSIDDMLGGLGLSEAQRLAWYRDQQVPKLQSGAWYRQRSNTLRAHLGDPTDLGRQPGSAPVAVVLAQRREVVGPVGRDLRDLGLAGLLGQDLSSLLRSFVHMHCNRLFTENVPPEHQLLGLLERTRHSLECAPVNLA